MKKESGYGDRIGTRSCSRNEGSMIVVKRRWRIDKRVRERWEPIKRDRTEVVIQFGWIITHDGAYTVPWKRPVHTQRSDVEL